MFNVGVHVKFLVNIYSQIHGAVVQLQFGIWINTVEPSGSGLLGGKKKSMCGSCRHHCVEYCLELH